MPRMDQYAAHFADKLAAARKRIAELEAALRELLDAFNPEPRVSTRLTIWGRAAMALDGTPDQDATAEAAEEGMAMGHDSNGSGYDLPRRLKQDAYAKSPSAPEDTDEWRAAIEIEAWRSVMPQYEFRDGEIKRTFDSLPPAGRS